LGEDFPPRDIQPLLPPSHRSELGNVRVARCDPGRQPASPVVRISPDVILPTRRLSYLARIPESHSGPFARRWRPSPLWDAASPHAGGRPTMDATRTQGGPAPTSPLDRGPIRLGKPSRPPSVHCGTLKRRTAPGRHPRMPPRTRELPPATTSPQLGIQKTPCRSARPEKDVTPRHKVPLHPIPPRGPKPSTSLKREHPPNHQDGRPHRKQQGHP